MVRISNPVRVLAAAATVAALCTGIASGPARAQSGDDPPLIEVSVAATPETIDDIEVTVVDADGVELGAGACDELPGFNNWQLLGDSTAVSTWRCAAPAGTYTVRIAAPDGPRRLICFGHDEERGGPVVDGDSVVVRTQEPGVCRFDAHPPGLRFWLPADPVTAMAPRLEDLDGNEVEAGCRRAELRVTDVIFHCDPIPEGRYVLPPQPIDATGRVFDLTCDGVTDSVEVVDITASSEFELEVPVCSVADEQIPVRDELWVPIRATPIGAGLVSVALVQDGTDLLDGRCVEGRGPSYLDDGIDGTRFLRCVGDWSGVAEFVLTSPVLAGFRAELDCFEVNPVSGATGVIIDFDDGGDSGRICGAEVTPPELLLVTPAGTAPDAVELTGPDGVVTSAICAPDSGNAAAGPDLSHCRPLEPGVYRPAVGETTFGCNPGYTATSQDGELSAWAEVGGADEAWSATCFAVVPELVVTAPTDRDDPPTPTPTPPTDLLPATGAETRVVAATGAVVMLLGAAVTAASSRRRVPSSGRPIARR